MQTDLRRIAGLDGRYYRSKIVERFAGQCPPLYRTGFSAHRHPAFDFFRWTRPHANEYDSRRVRMKLRCSGKVACFFRAFFNVSLVIWKVTNERAGGVLGEVAKPPSAVSQTAARNAG